MKLILPDSLRLAVEFQAAEAYPLEAIGALALVDNIIYPITCTLFVSRDGDSVVAPTDFHRCVEQITEDGMIGWFHSHPSAWATMSRISDFRRRKDRDISDEAYMEEDHYELITGVWPSRRKCGWTFQHRLYHKEHGKIRVVCGF